MPGIVIAAVMIVVYAIRWKVVAKHRPRCVGDLTAGGTCAWCRQPISEDEAQVAHDPDVEFLYGTWLGDRAHLRCEQGVVRRHLGYYRFFLGMAMLTVVTIVIGISCDAIGGIWIKPWDLPAFVGAIAPALVVAYVMRRAVVPWARRVEQAAREAEISEPADN